MAKPLKPYIINTYSDYIVIKTELSKYPYYALYTFMYTQFATIIGILVRAYIEQIIKYSKMFVKIC